MHAILGRLACYLASGLLLSPGLIAPAQTPAETNRIELAPSQARPIRNSRLPFLPADASTPPSAEPAATPNAPLAERPRSDAAAPAVVAEPEPTATDPCECEPFDWSKVPPNIRPHPRLGYFIIPPDRCGYYSVMDVIRGNLRDKPPIMPYAPISPSPGSFFDADYRYLDDPKNTDFDWLDCLKRMHCGDNFLLATGGEYRYRLMDEIGSRLTAVDNNYHLIRTRVWGDVWYRDRLRYYVEFIDAHAYNLSLPPLAIDNNTADFLNMFVDVKVLDRWNAPAYLRVGRQELNYGSTRLISPLDWANARRTFQGAKLFWTSEKWDMDLFWVKPVPVDPNLLDWWDYNRNFTGAWTTYKPKKGTTRDFYVLNLHQTLPAVGDGRGVTGPLDLTTFGTRWAGDKDGMWLYDLEGMIQTGIRANNDVTAYSATAGLGFRAKKRRLNPTVWAYYDYASGSRDPAVSGFNRTFNQLFAFGHYYFGFQDFVGRQNIHDVSVQASVNPAPFVTALFQYHHFELASPRDALYNAAGAVLRVDPTGASGQHIGDEFDFLTNVHINRHNDLLFGFSFLAPGRFLRSAGAGVPRDPKLYYLQYSYKW